MKVKLRSDFTDYYDHWFDLEGVEYRRVGTDGPSRSEMFEILRGLGLMTPTHGRLGEQDLGHREVVVYLDERLHCGEGKTRLLYNDAVVRHPGKLFSLFIPPGGVSIRHLHIGRRCFELQYRSVEDWRSNVGDGDCCVRGEIAVPTYRSKVAEALFAIDFVPLLPTEQLFAVDFNIAPGMRGSGMERVLSAWEAAELIKDYLEDSHAA